MQELQLVVWEKSSLIFGIYYCLHFLANLIHHAVSDAKNLNQDLLLNDRASTSRYN